MEELDEKRQRQARDSIVREHHPGLGGGVVRKEKGEKATGTRRRSSALEKRSLGRETKRARAKVEAHVTAERQRRERAEERLKRAEQQLQVRLEC